MGREGGVQKRCVNASASIILECEDFSCCLRCTGNTTDMGDSGNACLSFLSAEDGFVMVLQLKAAREEHPCDPGGNTLDMDLAFPRGKCRLQGFIRLVKALFEKRAWFLPP
jgi:hypothetical protein